MNANTTATPNTIDILSDLVRRHRFSAVRYLQYAEPWTDSQAAKDTIGQIAQMQLSTAERMERLILERDGEIPVGDFPIEFTSWHDLSLAYLIPKVVSHQQALVITLRNAATQLDDDPEAQAVVDEALGEANGHLEMLQELAAAQRAA